MKALTTLAVFALGACATAPAASTSPTAALGEMAYTNGLRVRPLEVLEDSRCPALVRCVWAGRIIVRSEVIGGSWRRTLDLELGKQRPIADGALTLVEVAPGTIPGARIDTRTYRFTFDFQGGI